MTISHTSIVKSWEMAISHTSIVKSNIHVTYKGPNRNLFSFDGASEVRSRVRRGFLSLRVVLQMWS